jgi:hypothetical protein
MEIDRGQELVAKGNAECQLHTGQNWWQRKCREAKNWWQRKCRVATAHWTKLVAKEMQRGQEPVEKGNEVRTLHTGQNWWQKEMRRGQSTPERNCGKGNGQGPRTGGKRK